MTTRRLLLVFFALMTSAAHAGAVDDAFPTRLDIERARPRCLDIRYDPFDSSPKYRAGYRDWLTRQGVSTANYDAWEAKRAACPRHASEASGRTVAGSGHSGKDYWSPAIISPGEVTPGPNGWYKNQYRQDCKSIGYRAEICMFPEPEPTATPKK